MHEDFWQARWRENMIGFHERKPNNLLVESFHHLGLQKGQTVFVPLCGKSVDLDWLLSRDLRVRGVEYSKKAVEAVFERLNLTPSIATHGAHIRYEAGNLTLLVGDFFALTAQDVGRVDAVYDRAALVAVSPAERAAYARHLTEMSARAAQLLITYDYDQREMDGPPFSVPGAALRALYSDRFRLTRLNRRDIAGQLSRRCDGSEEAWLLQPDGRP